MDEALALGARLVTVGANVETIRTASSSEPESGRFLLVDQRMTLGSGSDRIEVYEVTTMHAESYLLVYAPGTRTLFTADHFGSPYVEGVPTANLNTLSLFEALQPLQLNFNKIVTAHGGRVFTARDLRNSVDAFEDWACPEDRALCVDL